MDLIGYIVPIGRNCTLLIYIERTLVGKELAAHKLVAYSLRPLTRRKRFLLFLPDSHSAYYNSFVSCLPHWVFQGFVALGHVSGGNEGRGGGWAHPPTLATLGKIALEASVGFLSIGRSDYKSLNPLQTASLPNLPPVTLCVHITLCVCQCDVILHVMCTLLNC